MNATENPSNLVSEIHLTKRPCPQCGQKMQEMDRVLENGSVFIWYECTEINCGGQWLQKFPQMSY